MAAILRQTSYADFRITVRNQQALIANLFRLDEEAKEVLRDRVDFWAHEMQARAIELAPIGKDTDPWPHPGFLKQHIEVRFSKSHLAFELGCWAEAFDAINENLYAIFQEYGTSFHEAQPFLNPTFEEMGPEMTQDIGATIRQLARERGGPGSG